MESGAGTYLSDHLAGVVYTLGCGRLGGPSSADGLLGFLGIPPARLKTTLKAIPKALSHWKKTARLTTETKMLKPPKKIISIGFPGFDGCKQKNRLSGVQPHFLAHLNFRELS